jgi:hypothetical protein
MRKVLAFVMCVTGCGDNKSGGDFADAGPGGGDGSIPYTADAATGACTEQSNCGAGICDPTTHMCVTTLGCTTHADCGVGAFCDATSGKCTPNHSGGPCSTDDNCVGGEKCIGGTMCGCNGDVYGATKVPPNVLIVLDRSRSMLDSLGADGSKWSVAQTAIANLVSAHSTDVNWGLSFFPGTDLACNNGAQCTAGAVEVDPAAGTSSTIGTDLTTANTCQFGTPTAEHLTMLETYAGLQDTTRANYILLVTDGMATCNDPVPVVMALANPTTGVPPVDTFVVGFGSAVDPTQLNDMAVAGNTAIGGGPPAPTPYYYQADSAAALDAAFATIAGSVLSCAYALSSTPPDITMLYVSFDGTVIPQDTTHATGWDYDPTTNQIIFSGASCSQLKAGSVQNLVVSYGCPVTIG